MFTNLLYKKEALISSFFCIPLSRYLVALADDVGLKSNTSAKVNLHILTFIPVLAPTMLMNHANLPPDGKLRHPYAFELTLLARRKALFP